jgi:hypothetical protein
MRRRADVRGSSSSERGNVCDYQSDEFRIGPWLGHADMLREPTVRFCAQQS